LGRLFLRDICVSAVVDSFFLFLAQGCGVIDRKFGLLGISQIGKMTSLKKLGKDPSLSPRDDKKSFNFLPEPN